MRPFSLSVILGKAQSKSDWDPVLQARPHLAATFHSSATQGFLSTLVRPPKLIVIHGQPESLSVIDTLRRLRLHPRTAELPVLLLENMTREQGATLEQLGWGRLHYDARPLAASTLLDAIEATLNKAPSSASTTADFGDYRIQRLVRKTHPGHTYEAQHPVRKKVFLHLVPQSPAYLPLKEQEFDGLLAQYRNLSHRNLPRIQHGFQTPDFRIIETEPAEGKALEELLDVACLSMPDKRSIVTQIFDAVNALHHKGLVHGDLGPWSFLRRTDGVILLIDLAFTRHPGWFQDQFRLLGPSAEVLGSQATWAPEVLQGASFTAQSDQFSLGRTIQCILENSRPITDQTPLHQSRPELPQELSEALQRMTHPNPTERFPHLSAAKSAVLMTWPFDPEMEHSLFT